MNANRLSHELSLSPGPAARSPIRTLTSSTPSRLLYWFGMTHRVGAKGQVVIPKDLRERAGLVPGADVEFAWDGSGVSVRAADTSDEMGGRFAHSGMAARLLDDRSHEPR